MSKLNLKSALDQAALRPSLLKNIHLKATYIQQDHTELPGLPTLSLAWNIRQVRLGLGTLGLSA